MLTSDQVFDAIEHIAETPGKKDKERLVGTLLENELARRVLVACYDPFVTYGIAKRPKIEPHRKNCNYEFTDATWAGLDDLAARRLTGNAAIEWVTDHMEDLSPASEELFWRIISKDMRAGFTEGTINRAKPGTIFVFDCMLAHPYKEHKHKLAFPLRAEPKLDGVRVLSIIDTEKGSVRFFSRSGKEFTTFDHLKAPLLDAASTYRSTLMAQACDAYDQDGLPDGENTDTNALDAYYADHRVDAAFHLIIEAEVVSGSFNKTVGDVRRKNEQAKDAKLCVFDLLFKSDFDHPGPKDEVGEEPYFMRRSRLEAFVKCAPEGAPIVLLPSKTVNDEQEIHEYYEACRARGLEGLIIKDPQALYYRKRHHAWSKIKAEETLDLKIVDAFEGEGKYAGMLGGFVVDYKGKRVSVGGGFSDDQRKEFWEAFLADTRNPEGPWDTVGRLAEVQYHEETPDGSLRHPRFVRFRDDRGEADGPGC